MISNCLILHGFLVLRNILYPNYQMLDIFCQNMLNHVEQVFISSLLATHNYMASLMHVLKKTTYQKSQKLIKTY